MFRSLSPGVIGASVESLAGLVQLLALGAADGDLDRAGLGRVDLTKQFRRSRRAAPAKARGLGQFEGGEQETHQGNLGSNDPIDASVERV